MTCRMLSGWKVGLPPPVPNTHHCPAESWTRQFVKSNERGRAHLPDPEVWGVATEVVRVALEVWGVVTEMVRVAPKGRGSRAEILLMRIASTKSICEIYAES